MEDRKNWKHWAIGIIGVWALLSPLLFTMPSGTAMTIILALVILASGILLLFAEQVSVRMLHWVSIIAAAIWFLLPWMAGYSGAAAWNARIFGVILVILSWMYLKGEKKEE